MPALSPRGNQALLFPAANDQLTQSLTFETHSSILPQSIPVADDTPYEQSDTIVTVEVENGDDPPQAANIIPTGFSTADLHDGPAVFGGESSKCHIGIARRCWNTVASVYDRFASTAFRKSTVDEDMTHLHEETTELGQFVHEQAQHAHEYCILFGLCSDSAEDRIHQDEGFAPHGDKSHPLDSELDKEQILPKVPSYVLEYAPYVHLYSGEQYWPCDIAKHLHHTTPYLNYTPAQAKSDHVKLDNLDDLNKWGRYVYLTSNDNVEEQPEWLLGESNIPESRPQCQHDATAIRDANDDDPPIACGQKKKGYSDAPAILIVVEKDDGVVDAFWFFFYSFNKGNKVFNVRFGNHIGDWEHTTIRFVDGEPTSVFLSEHDFGDSFTFDALEKRGKRVSIEN